ncbi:hypothetical protein Golob_011466, partial [Gossypium lobatum]|nr:hypothetical protein [Gossypium lobatum]
EVILLVACADIILKIFCTLSKTAQELEKFGHRWRLWKLFLFQGASWSVTEIIKLCTDGVIKVVLGSIAAGGFLRNENGEWIIDFNRFLGECSVFDAELWGILDGLSLIHDSSFAEVMMQTNNLEVVKAIQETSSSILNSALISCIHHLLENVGPWGIQHILRKFNNVVDCIAKLAFDTRHGLKVFKEIPRDVLATSPVVLSSGNLP